MFKRTFLYSALALLTGASAVSAFPVSADNAGWLAFEGCWRTPGISSDNMLCIVRDGAGARMITYADGNIVSESRMVADGRARPVSKEGCTGTEQAVWSADHARVFVTADMTCGDHTRKVSGILAIQSPSEWISVQSVKYGDQSVGRTQRYVEVNLNAVPEAITNTLRANQLARETARYSASATLTFDDVKEAVARVAAPAVADWLSEADQPFKLNAKSLIDLADAGVPADVIDVMVAVSNPQHFAVNNSRTVERSDRDWDRRYASRRGYSCNDYYDPWWGSSYSYGAAYGNGCYADRGYYYSPWGYDPFGWRQGGTTVIVVRGSTGSDDASNARVTRHGYTKGTSGSDDSSARSTSSSSTTRSSSSGNSSSSSSSSAPAASSSSSTRTAKPRDQ